MTTGLQITTPTDTTIVLTRSFKAAETMKLGSGETVLSLVETHEFTDTGGATQMRITQTYTSQADRDGALASGMDQGMEACYQQLDAVVAL